MSVALLQAMPIALIESSLLSSTGSLTSPSPSRFCSNTLVTLLAHFSGRRHRISSFRKGHAAIFRRWIRHLPPQCRHRHMRHWKSRSQLPDTSLFWLRLLYSTNGNERCGTGTESESIKCDVLNWLCWFVSPNNTLVLDVIRINFHLQVHLLNVRGETNAMKTPSDYDDNDVFLAQSTYRSVIGLESFFSMRRIRIRFVWWAALFDDSMLWQIRWTNVAIILDFARCHWLHSSR